MEIPKVLMTGGSGFLGKNIAKMLLERNYLVSNLVNISSSLELTEYEGYKELSIEGFNKTCDFDIILHCATSYGKDNISYTKVFEPNLYLPLQLLIERMHNSKPYFFINIDTTLEATTSQYALSKSLFLSSAEQLIKEYQPRNLKFINIKLEHFYGPDAPSHNFITYLVNSMQEKTLKINLTLGEQERDFIYVKDAVNAISVIVEEAKNFENIKNYFEVGSGENITIRNAVTTIADFLSYDQKKINFGAVPYRKNEKMVSEISLKKIKNLGWLPKYSFAEGISEMLKK